MTVTLVVGQPYSLPNGQEVVVRAAGDRYELCSWVQWRNRTPATYAVEASGRITIWGCDTGWRAGDLRPIDHRERTGRTEPVDGDTLDVASATGG